MDAFEIEQLLAAQHREGEHTYADVFRAGTFSLGLAVWPAGKPDEQRPHTEDEVYVVLSGRGRIGVGREERAIGAGSVVFVPTGIEHRFFDIEEDLRVLVVWSPPYRSRSGAAAAGEAAAH